MVKATAHRIQNVVIMGSELVGILLPHINTRDCLEVCATMILKPAGLLYMYSVNMKLSSEWGMG